MGYNKGSSNGRWKGGRRKDAKGYWRVWKPRHPLADGDGYVKEHRLVMEQMIGRLLKAEEVVGHRNNIRDDNTPQNLKLYKNQSEHMKEHYPKGKAVA